ncbi:hypothetical protein ABIC56_000213 [Acinetobacter bereziniae]
MVSIYATTAWKRSYILDLEYMCLERFHLTLQVLMK